MADQFSTNLKYRLPETGAYANSWGTVLNTDAIELIDQSVAGLAEINVGLSTSYSMPALSDGAASDSRAMILQFSGTPASAVTVTLPATVGSKLYMVANDTGQNLTIKYSGSTGVVINDGTVQPIITDGEEVYRLTADAVNAQTLAGVAAALYARLDVPQSFNAGQAYPFTTLTDAASITIDCEDGNNFLVVLSGNRTLENPINATSGLTIQVFVRQDGTGSRTLAYGSKFRWPDDVAPTLTTTPNRGDLIIATYNATLDRWIASIIQNFNP